MKEFAKKFWLLGLVLVLAFGLTVVAAGCGGCGGDDDDDDDSDDDFDDDFDDDDDDDDDDDCAGNHAPELLAVYYFIGTEQQTPPVTIDQADVSNFGVYFEYADVDCNLPGGHFYYNINDEGWEDLGVLPEDLGCSSADSGLLYGIVFNEAEPGTYNGQTKWTDVCGEESNIMDFAFTVE